MKNEARLNLKQAAKAYWHHLVAAPLFLPFADYVVRHTHGNAGGIAIFFSSFFIMTVYCYWPYLRGRVRQSYSLLAGFLYVFGGVAMVLIIKYFSMLL